MITPQLMLEEALASMGHAFDIWMDDCEKCYRCQDSPARFEAMRLSYQRFIAAQERWLEIARKFGLEAVSQPGM